MLSERGVDAKSLIAQADIYNVYHNCNEKMDEQKSDNEQPPLPPPMINGDGKYPEGELDLSLNISLSLSLLHTNALTLKLDGGSYFKFNIHYIRRM